MTRPSRDLRMMAWQHLFINLKCRDLKMYHLGKVKRDVMKISRCFIIILLIYQYQSREHNILNSQIRVYQPHCHTKIALNRNVTWLSGSKIVLSPKFWQHIVVRPNCVLHFAGDLRGRAVAVSCRLAAVTRLGIVHSQGTRLVHSAVHLHRGPFIHFIQLCIFQSQDVIQSVLISDEWWFPGDQPFAD